MENGQGSNIYSASDNGQGLQVGKEEIWWWCKVTSNFPSKVISRSDKYSRGVLVISILYESYFIMLSGKITSKYWESWYQCVYFIRSTCNLKN